LQNDLQNDLTAGENRSEFQMGCLKSVESTMIAVKVQQVQPFSRSLCYHGSQRRRAVEEWTEARPVVVPHHCTPYRLMLLNVQGRRKTSTSKAKGKETFLLSLMFLQVILRFNQDSAPFKRLCQEEGSETWKRR
jgi:hypothetical protein